MRLILLNAPGFLLYHPRPIPYRTWLCVEKIPRKSNPSKKCRAALPRFAKSTTGTGMGAWLADLHQLSLGLVGNLTAPQSEHGVINRARIWNDDK